MTAAVKWLPKPQKQDYQAAEDYLSLILLLRGIDDHPLIVAASYHRQRSPGSTRAPRPP